MVLFLLAAESTLNLLQRYGGRDYKASKAPAHGFLLLNLITVCAHKHFTAHAHFCEIICQMILKQSWCSEVTRVSTVIRVFITLLKIKSDFFGGRRSSVTFILLRCTVECHFSGSSSISVSQAVQYKLLTWGVIIKNRCELLSGCEGGWASSTWWGPHLRFTVQWQWKCICLLHSPPHTSPSCFHLL